ncbi:hypothetical protein ACFXG6_19850 [Streptomyces roseus]|uniref:hypothetical protein n=1 Tax=Streptomyces roseus TaxID=66430 RepID=UPI0036A1B950
MSSYPSTLIRTAGGAPAGLVAAFTALAVAESVVGRVRPATGPVAALDGAVIDRTAAAVKNFAIRAFGAADELSGCQHGVSVTVHRTTDPTGQPSGIGSTNPRTITTPNRHTVFRSNSS